MVSCPPTFPEDWTCEDVCQWLINIGLERLVDKFTYNEINGEILLTMTQNDLENYPLSVAIFGVLRKFSIEVEKLKADYIVRTEQQQNDADSVIENPTVTNDIPPVTDSPPPPIADDIPPITENPPIINGFASPKFVCPSNPSVKSESVDDSHDESAVSVTFDNLTVRNVAGDVAENQIERISFNADNLQSTDPSLADEKESLITEPQSTLDSSQASSEIETPVSVVPKQPEPFRDLMAQMLEDENRRIEEIKAKELKMKEGRYDNYFEAFLDGAPGFADAESDNEEYALQQSLKKSKTLKQMKQKGSMTRRAKDIKLPSATSVDKSPSASSSQTSQRDGNSVVKDLLNEESVRSNTPTFQAENGNFYVKWYEKSVEKPPKSVTKVQIVRVSSVREIYVRTEEQDAYLENYIKPYLKEILDHSSDGYCFPISDDMIVKDYACCYKLPNSCVWARARFGAVNGPADRQLPVILIDYAKLITISGSERQNLLKMLPANDVLRTGPQVYKCKLENLCDRPPAQSETALLKQMVNEGSLLFCMFDRNSGEPYKIRLQLPDGRVEFEENFLEELEKKKKHSEYYVYNPSGSSAFSRVSPRKNNSGNLPNSPNNAAIGINNGLVDYDVGDEEEDDDDSDVEILGDDV